MLLLKAPAFLQNLSFILWIVIKAPFQYVSTFLIVYNYSKILAAIKYKKNWNQVYF